MTSHSVAQVTPLGFSRSGQRGSPCLYLPRGTKGQLFKLLTLHSWSWLRAPRTSPLEECLTAEKAPGCPPAHFPCQGLRASVWHPRGNTDASHCLPSPKDSKVPRPAVWAGPMPDRPPISAGKLGQYQVLAPKIVKQGQTLLPPRGWDGKRKR